MKSDGITPVTLRIRQYMRTQIEATLAAEGRADLPALATQAEAHFLGDADFQTQIGEMVRIIAYTQGTQLFSGTRHDGGSALYGDAVMDADAAKGAADAGIAKSSALSRWATWVEHAGKRFVPLMQMVDTDLRAAADTRFKRSDTEREIGVLWLALADKLEGGQSVGERFTADEIESMRVKLAAERTKKTIDSAQRRR